MAFNMSTEKFHSSIERRGSDGTTETESCNIKEREGGRVAWLTVVGSILVYYCSAGLVNSFGFFQAYYTRDFLDQTQTSTIAFIGTLQICLVNVLAAVSGTLCDFYGVKVSEDDVGMKLQLTVSSGSTFLQDAAPSSLCSSCLS